MNREKKIWVILAISTLFYFAMNALALLIRQGVPGMTTMIGWGIVMPLLMIVVWWTVAITSRGELTKWWLAGLLATVFFASAGIVTAKIIASMWASV